MACLSLSWTGAWALSGCQVAVYLPTISFNINLRSVCFLFSEYWQLIGWDMRDFYFHGLRAVC